MLWQHQDSGYAKISSNALASGFSGETVANAKTANPEIAAK